MMRALVIADDLTGAAEIAGVGVRYGLPTRLMRATVGRCEPGLTVVDTDSRLLTRNDAVQRVRRFVGNLRTDDFNLIYKKTDSVLRGPIVAEVEALMEAFGRPAALLVPQNPSRGRVIRNGEYFIDGVPLDATEFASDPDDPARTASVSKRLGVRCIKPSASPPHDEIAVAEAASASDVWQWARVVTDEIVPAGGADFFSAILEARSLFSRATTAHLVPGVSLFICGSASEYSHEFAARAEQRNIAVCRMPASEANADDWATAASAALKTHSVVLMTIGRAKENDPGSGQRLQSSLAQAAAQVMNGARIANVFMEGGATASAVCVKMGWGQFDVSGEFAPGVVQMRTTDAQVQTIIVKPGSYPWPEVIWQELP